MYNKNDLDKDISQIWLIYTTSYEYYNCLSQVKSYKKTEFSDSRFMSFIIYTSWYVLIIELCKVYQNDNKNQHFNLFCLINKLLNNYKNLDFKSLITLESITDYHARFNSSEIIDIRERLVTLRDKFYAHFDKDNLENEVNIKLTEIEILLNLLKNFITDIKYEIFGSQVEFENDIYVQINKALECIEDSNKRYHDEMIHKFNEEMKGLK
jgi:hypothetical protein